MKRRRSSAWLGRANPYYQGQPSDHFDGRVFFNPDGVAPAGFVDLLKWQIGGGRATWPPPSPSPFSQAKPKARISRGRLVVTMVGHATLLVQIAGLNILTDPVWSPRVSPFSFAGPKRANEPGIAFGDLPAIDAVLVSHNHYDHLDIATLKRLTQRGRPPIVTPLGNDAIIRRRVPDANLLARDWRETIPLPGGAAIHLVPVHHWSARGPWDRRMALWCGFVIESAAGNVFFAGDTGFDAGRPYHNVVARFGPPRLAILPIGAYAPRWFMKPQHQNPEEAVAGMMLCGARFAAGCHWGTFQLTDEPIEEPRDLLLAALDKQGVARERFRPMRPGEVWEVPAE